MLIWLWILAVRHFQKSRPFWLLSSCSFSVMWLLWPHLEYSYPLALNTISSFLNHFKYVVSFTHICWLWMLCEDAHGNSGAHQHSDCISLLPLPHLLTREVIMSTPIEKLRVHFLLAQMLCISSPLKGPRNSICKSISTFDEQSVASSLNHIILPELQIQVHTTSGQDQNIWYWFISHMVTYEKPVLFDIFEWISALDRY